jgi:transglutaminase-like putative cysteine protease
MPSSVSADASAVTYDVVHRTQYSYSEAVSVSQHIARLTPRGLPHQECLEHRLQVDPLPAVRSDHLDYFGNRATLFSMQGGHRRLTVTARSRVKVQPRPLPRGEDTPPWEAATDHQVLPLEAVECIFDSPSIRVSSEFTAYARVSFTPGRPLLDAFADLTRRIHEDFIFEPGVTTVATDLDNVFRQRRGVCQDFACFEIACLRSLGLPAQYISGYLETVAPSGGPRRVGADASHAWLALYCPAVGWIEADPTNNLLSSAGHVTLARGRDYGDVSPIRGVILGGGDHTLHVSVDVVRVPARDGG